MARFAAIGLLIIASLQAWAIVTHEQDAPAPHTLTLVGGAMR